MEKICVLDLNNDGHHWFYNYNLMSNLKNNEIFYITSNLDEDKKKLLEDNNIIIKETNSKEAITIMRQINYFKEIIFTLRYCLKKKIDKLLIIHFDKYIIQFILLQIIFNLFNIKVIATLHWFPNNRIKKILIKFFDENNIIIVHTDDVKQKLGNIGVKNVKKINYPVFINNNEDKIEAAKCINTDLNKINILYFGGTREDKGIDILLDSLIFVKSKNKIRLIIAGKEEYFKENFILSKLKEIKGLEYKLDLKYITDEMVSKYFYSAHLVVLPYRKIFNGESGIITEALNCGIPVIAPDIIHFREKIGECGFVYKCENCKELAFSIDKAIINIDELTKSAQKYKKIFRKKHSIENFAFYYSNIIENL